MRATNIFSAFCLSRPEIGCLKNNHFMDIKEQVVLIIIFCNFIQQQLRADDFQIPPHRQALSVVGKHIEQFDFDRYCG